MKDNDRRNMPKHVGSDPRPAPGVSPSLPPGGIFPQDYPPLLLGPAVSRSVWASPYLKFQIFSATPFWIFGFLGKCFTIKQ